MEIDGSMVACLLDFGDGSCDDLAVIGANDQMQEI
jgi:hypothetical protein